MAVNYVEFEGTYRRLIDLKTWDSHTVVGWLEDDYHHFGMTLVHDGLKITEVRVAEPRYPWTACPGAEKPLQALVGSALFGRCSDIGKLIDMRIQCTHLFDLAGLLIAHAYHQRDHLRYHAAVCRLDSVEPGAPANLLRATLHRDDAQVMAWNLDNNTIVQPESAAGRSIDRGFREWIETMAEADAEHAFVLRRAAFVSSGRKIVLTEPHVADDMGLPAVCHTYQPENRKNSIRILESIRRFNKDPAGMLSLVETQP